MGKNKRGKRQRTTTEIIISSKAHKFIQAIKQYWREQDKLQTELNTTASALKTLPEGANIFPKDYSNRIWLLKDGLVFIRYKTEGAIPGKTDTTIINETLEDWCRRGIVIPCQGRDVMVPAIVVAPNTFLVLQNCSFNGLFIEYANISSLLYEQPELAPSISKAILDFKITVLGMMFQAGVGLLLPQPEQIIQHDKVIEILEQRVEELKNLLIGEVDEEKLQSFLKQNPFLLKPASDAIPKKKLGEDFITDFVLLNILDQGPIYTLVELEKSTHSILTKDYILTSAVNHAIKQTREWDVWLEKNKAYLQGKLHGFESPQFLIVIGRTQGMTEIEKTYLRSYNREYKNLTIISYDDLIAQTIEFIESAKRSIVNPI